MFGAIQVQRAHQVDIVFIKLRVLEKLPERRLYHSDTLFRRVDFIRLFFIQRYEPVPDIALVLFQSRLHFRNSFLRQKPLAVKHARGLLQVFESGNLSHLFARNLAFRRDVFVYVLAARHIVKAALSSMRFSFESARLFTQAIRRIFDI